MLKTSTKPIPEKSVRRRFALNGPAMGSRFSAIFFAPFETETATIQVELADALEQVEQQMSTYRPQSALMRLNAEPVGRWVELPDLLFQVLVRGLAVERDTEGAFDIGVGDLVAAAGFGAQAVRPDPARLAGLAAQTRTPSSQLLEIDPEGGRVRKHGALDIDLSGIAKGFGVDRLAKVLQAHGIQHYLVSIDGEMRAGGGKIDGNGHEQPWTIAIEKPDRGLRQAGRLLGLKNFSVATSGDYRHFHAIGEDYLSHTMDPRTGKPLQNDVASVTVIAEQCMDADALASALMVHGPEGGPRLAEKLGVPALFMIRQPGGRTSEVAVGHGW